MRGTAAARIARLEARVTHEQKQLLQRAANLRGQSLTDFIVSSTHEAAVREIEFADAVTLTRRDQELLVNVLMNPPTPNERLRRAADTYNKPRTRPKAAERR